MKIFLLALALFAVPSVTFAAVSAPNSLTISPGQYTNDTTPTFSWSAPSGATWYDVAVDAGGYSGIGNVLSYTLPTQANGWHTFYVRAHDNSNAVSGSNALTFEIDTVGPTVSRVSISKATANVPTTVSVSTSGESAVASCRLMIDHINLADMTKNGDTWSANYAFAAVGNAGSGTVQAAVSCTDGDGNSTLGASRTVTVTGYTVAEAYAGDRIKTACGSNVRKSDACHAVYYLGADGKRHAFPTEAVYYTWYSNWSGVKTVSQAFMSTLSLGKNVTLHPGTALVKFTSTNEVYAVSRGAVLHHYLTEALVKADYGNNWQASLVSVSAVLRGNYSIGSVIDSTSDYDAATAKAAVTSIDSNF